jgi:hypothetical protein
MRFHRLKRRTFVEMLRDGEYEMSTSRFDNFGDLYRAAFAENDPEIKQLLLADVKCALDRWAESERNSFPSPTSPRPSRPRPPRPRGRSSIYRVA